MKRVRQPSELLFAYVFPALDDTFFIAGQVIHVNGGEIIDRKKIKE